MATISLETEFHAPAHGRWYRPLAGVSGYSGQVPAVQSAMV